MRRRTLARRVVIDVRLAARMPKPTIPGLPLAAPAKAVRRPMARALPSVPGSCLCTTSRLSMMKRMLYFQP